MIKFKDYFRNTDVLLIDDIQFMNGKEALHEEFFNTFTSLLDKLSNKNKSQALKDITKDKSEYKKLSKYQKHISDLINDYEPTKKKLEKKNLQYCKNKTKGLKATTDAFIVENLPIVD